MSKIKVLHAFTTLDNGGVESFLFNYYSLMPKEKIQFDFLILGEKIGFLEKYFIEWNSEIFHIPRIKTNPCNHFKTIQKIMKNGNYDVLHLHGYKSSYLLPIGKNCGIKTRIIHSHMANVTESKKERLLRKIYKTFIKKYATNRFACGKDAAIWLFGSTTNVDLFHNAINLEKFKFNTNVRKKLRTQLGISQDTIVLGNVARLSYQKNQEYLLDILDKLISKNNKIKLIHIGSGEDEEIFKEKIKKKRLSEFVETLGVKENINDYLSVMDIFLLPSRYEGLPVILIEVQASGLYSIVSNNITKEMNVIENMDFLSIEKDSINEWVKKILYFENNNRVKISDKMIGGNYDITLQSKKLIEKYYQLVKGKDYEIE
ncbi:TPA: glycosyltransferase [Streptococcus suis]